jgi:hypothetical protein
MRKFLLKIVFYEIHLLLPVLLGRLVNVPFELIRLLLCFYVFDSYYVKELNSCCLLDKCAFNLGPKLKLIGC